MPEKYDACYDIFTILIFRAKKGRRIFNARAFTDALITQKSRSSNDAGPLLLRLFAVMQAQDVCLFVV